MNSDGVEHLSSVHNNPFIRQFGRLQHPVSQPDAVERESSIPSSASSDKGDDDSLQEYHVNSGFVNKLRSKFAQLESKSQKVSLSRKSASVENLLSIGQSSNDVVKTRRWPKDDSATSDEKVELRKHVPAGYKPQIGRPRSFDVLESDKTEKPALAKKKELEHLRQKNVTHSVKPALPKNFFTGSSRKTGTETSVPKHEHHDWTIAPDVEKIGRDNIIIIESSDSGKDVQQNEQTKHKTEVNEDSADGFRQVKPITDMEQVRDENELPKRNTVSQFRTLFEKTSKTKDSLNVWQQLSRRKSSESETYSPRVTSPVSNSPRSPLVKVSDNVFEDSSKINFHTEPNIVSSPRNSSNLETNTLSSARNSTSADDYAQNVDTTPVDIQKSRELFRKNSVDIDKTFDKNAQQNRSSVSESKQEEPLSPSVQSSVTTVHPLSKVFDSSKIAAKKPDKPKRPKPIGRKSHHLVPKDEQKLDMDQKHKKLTNDSVELKLKYDRRKHGIPKDTIELKHEADQKRRESMTLEKEASTTQSSEEDKLTNDNSEGVISEFNVKPSGNLINKISPRKTQIFDSSDIIKKDKESPRTPVSPVENAPSYFTSNIVPKEVSVEIVDAEKSRENTNVEVAMDISPEKPAKLTESSVSGLTEIKPKIEQKHKPRKFKVKEQNFIKAETAKELEREKPIVNENTTPVTGMSSFLANRLKKTSHDQENQLKTSSVHLANGSSPSPVPRKRQAPERPVQNGPKMDIGILTENSVPPLPSTPEPTLPKTNIDDVINRPFKNKTAQSATKMVFDSSKIATKRKEPPKRKPPRKSVDQMNKDMSTSKEISVPKLDLSSITGEPQQSEFQEGYIPTVIKPCPVKFLGSEITFEKSPYKRTKKNKVKISFDDHATTTFEYDHEETALEKYLQEHPEERDEAMRQEEETNGSADISTTDLLKDSPHIPEPEPTMKSNTVIGTSGGGLTSYKSKIQTLDFQFGMTLEPEIEESQPEPEPEEYPESLDLLPADDAETDMFSAEVDKADMLF